MGFMDVTTTTNASFSFNRVGDVCSGTIVELDDGVKTTGDKGEDITSLVITVAVDAAKSISHDREKDPIALTDGETRAVWVAYHRKALVKAIQDAIREAGATGLEVGGRLALKFERNGDQKDKSKSPPKLFVAKYTPAPKTVSLDEF